MTAEQIISSFQARGVAFQAAGDRLRYNAPPGSLTDADRHTIQCYKTELLWRLRHPEGDPGPEGYSAKLFVNGERVAVPLDQLIAEGRRLIESGESDPSEWARANLDPDMLAAAMAVRRYDERHREWAEANRARSQGAANG